MIQKNKHHNMKRLFLLVITACVCQIGCKPRENNSAEPTQVKIEPVVAPIPPQPVVPEKQQTPAQKIDHFYEVYHQAIEPLFDKVLPNGKISEREAAEVVKQVRTIYFPARLEESFLYKHVHEMLTKIELSMVQFSDKVPDPTDATDPAARILLEEVLRFLEAFADTLMATPNCPEKGAMLSISAGTPEAREEVRKRQMEAEKYGTGAAVHRSLRSPLYSRLLPALEKRLEILAPAGREEYTARLQKIKEKLANVPKVGEEAKTP